MIRIWKADLETHDSKQITMWSFLQGQLDVKLSQVLVSKVSVRLQVRFEQNGTHIVEPSSKAFKMIQIKEKGVGGCGSVAPLVNGSRQVGRGGLS